MAKAPTGVWLDKARRFVKYWHRQRSPSGLSGCDIGWDLQRCWPVSRLLKLFRQDELLPLCTAATTYPQVVPCTGTRPPTSMHNPRAMGVSTVALRAPFNTPIARNILVNLHLAAGIPLYRSASHSVFTSPGKATLVALTGLHLQLPAALLGAPICAIDLAMVAIAADQNLRAAAGANKMAGRNLRHDYLWQTKGVLDGIRPRMQQ